MQLIPNRSNRTFSIPLYNTRHNGTQHNGIQHTDTQHNDPQYNDTEHNGLICDTQHK
jgi:hypothetical protein